MKSVFMKNFDIEEVLKFKTNQSISAIYDNIKVSD